MMLCAEAMGPAGSRSSMEVMLEAIRRRDEQPRDLPPALPARPTSIGRLPASRRSFPVNCILKSKGEEIKSKDIDQKNELVGGMGLEKSSNFRMGELESCEQRSDAEDPVTYKFGSASLAVNRCGHFKSYEAIDYFLKKKLQVWCWLLEEKWECGNIQSATVNDANVLTSSGKILRLSFENILPANPEIQDDVNDMALLCYINEPSVLHSLKYRFSQDMSYTKVGPVLVAVNPFKELSPHTKISNAACQIDVGDSPHVLAIVHQAYDEFLRGGRSQSIIISGESGSGKTEVSKNAIQYLLSIANDGGIGVQVLKANSILESFGNAKSQKNDNSSRFSKHNEIHFSEAGKICGVQIKTFLLEKSRVVQRAVGERSYHVFYQLCAGAPPCLKEKLKLKSANEYEFLKQSKCLKIDNIDDANKFHLLMEDFDNAHISKEDQHNIFSMLAAVLWLGNIGFSTVMSEDHVEVNLDEAVTNAATLLGCEVNALALMLSTRIIHSGYDTIVQKLTLSQAIDSRDALAKSIYGALFDWVVGLINKSLQVGETHAGSSILILDICGFEYSHKNGFEQFCRNYANERIQQHFICNLLKREQEEYTIDGLDWRKTDFADNGDCLNLFEKPQGILSLLDEESASSKGTDLTILDKLKQKFHGNPYFKGESNSFRICHYTGEVLYNTSGFLKNNRDVFHEDSIKLLLSCSNQLSRVLASLISNGSPMQSTVIKLKDQLSKLTQQLENTNPHFIRCIIPNSKQLAGMFEEDFVVRQLRSFSLLEVARIAKSGYPTRMTHFEFVERYKCMLMENTAALDPISAALAVLRRCNVFPGMYQVGCTKIFLRIGQLAVLETARARTLQGIMQAQKFFCGARARRVFADTKKGAMALQSFIRAEGARHEFQNLVRRHRAAVLIQKHVKQWVAQKAFFKQRKHIVFLQSVIRSWLARKHLNRRRNLEKAKSDNVNLERGQSKKLHELKNTQQEHPLVLPSDMADLKSRVMEAEVEMRLTKEENSSLRKQLQQYELRWSEYDVKMKSMELMWQKQMSTLQMSLAAAKRSLATNNVAGKPDQSPTYPYFDYEDAISLETYTTDGTPAIGSRASGISNRTPDGLRNTINNLVREFEEKRQIFEDDAGFIVEVKSGLSISNIDPDQEFRKLKVLFASWKKNYKVRLRETKAVLQKLRSSETTKSRRKWWGKRSSK